MGRQNLSKKIRFEVFKRDSFQCQYCGTKAPHVLLEIDHIKPASKNGTNEILNLTTSCQDCNRGKSSRELNDKAVIHQQMNQLSRLQERREQLNMLYEWQRGLSIIEDEVCNKISLFWSEQVPGYSLTEQGKRDLKKLINKYSIEQVMEAIKISANQYLEYNKNEIPTSDSAKLTWKKVPGILRVKNNKSLETPKLYYIRGILRNRLYYVNEPLSLSIMQEAFNLGVSLESLERAAKDAKNWTEWRQIIKELEGLAVEQS